MTPFTFASGRAAAACVPRASVIPCVCVWFSQRCVFLAPLSVRMYGIPRSTHGATTHRTHTERPPARAPPHLSLGEVLFPGYFGALFWRK